MARKIGLILLPVLSLLGLSPLHGQTAAEMTRHRQRCEAASRALVSGRSDRPLKPVLGDIRGCGVDAWGAAVSAAAQRERTSTDISRLEDLWFPFQQLRDRRMYEVALRVATDGSASVPARVMALRGLRWMLRGPDQIVDGYTQMVSGPDRVRRERRSCSFRPMVNWTWEEGEPLPPDYRERIRAAVQALALDPAEPRHVRIAANCV